MCAHRLVSIMGDTKQSNAVWSLLEGVRLFWFKSRAPEVLNQREKQAPRYWFRYTQIT